MSENAQKRALKNYRTRLNQRGLGRFEVMALDSDRELIRSLAKKLIENDSEATRLRAAVSRSISGEPAKTGGILEALRRSPLVGADLDIRRDITHGRKLDL